ncbi:PREDICTED: late cornified envelope-like proline-rich protein 1 [Wasmannia auropunctata]|uniref:late cornified envelope-like proline-rich protein 1 n=1 Tax=Wasmannia auropunctata TaxID=64793 RepID=UPI0005EDF66B|nr:PREDICTED: late cornified envelope-like proline-rich protein 1 [Wasmannia auropunctata]XP_011690768.1 PREDICTED: late cornified envelope-like proline-rich protein 1 [Wasmannia auropunctata]XP_011690769.1 PREDICTED: late cornified envelope-like proline-rich protein 1 [Wasmannia auropunctata]
MSRSCQNLCLPPPPSCCLPTRCPTSCSIICCTPPVNFPCLPRVSRVQYKIACPPPCIPKPTKTCLPTKTVIYLPPCPTCSVSSPPKMEMRYLPATPAPPSRFYVCNTNCVPCPPCPPPSCNSPSNKPPLCLPPCPPC